MSIKQVEDLQVGEDLAFQERQWKVERIGWALMALIALAGLAGLFGGGPLSAATVGGDNLPLEVMYGRFVRHRTPTELTLPRLKRVGFLGSPLRPVRASYAVMHGISTVSSSVTSRVPHGSLDVDARLGFRRTRPRSTLQVLPAQRFVGGTPYLYFQEPRE